LKEENESYGELFLPVSQRV